MRLLTVLICVLAALPPGCGREERAPADDGSTSFAEARAAKVDELVRAKWGKSLDELPTVTLQAISPHNENIQNEFQWAFSLHHALEYGQKVQIVWRDVGGGGSSIEKYLHNVYAGAASSDIDVLWGGGEFTFISLAKRGLLQPMRLADDVLANVPREVGGVTMYAGDEGGVLWIGSAVSGFGFLYNAGILAMCDIAPPKRWEDLGSSAFTGLVTLADPGQSGSAAAAFRMIVVSEPTWPEGWTKLMMIVSNARSFTDSAGSAANAPVLGESPVATCIDFYGIIRVVEDPSQLVYISPPGQTTFSPDPIGILKNPPHGQLAQRFVDFVMSSRGQALWALPVGAQDGPVRFFLGRQPIRRDVYDIYAGKLGPRIVNPYAAGQALEITPQMQKVNFDVLRALVVSGILDNIDVMRAARKRLNSLQANPASVEEYRRRLAEFVALPDNIDTVEKMSAVAAALKDQRLAYQITTGWRDAFAAKFRRIAQ